VRRHGKRESVCNATPRGRLKYGLGWAGLKRFTKYFSLYLSSLSLTFLPDGVDLGSCKFVCALIRVKLDEKWQQQKIEKIEKSELSEMAITVIEKSDFFFFLTTMSTTTLMMTLTTTLTTKSTTTSTMASMMLLEV
jgi:hypothetical protein